MHPQMKTEYKYIPVQDGTKVQTTSLTQPPEYLYSQYAVADPDNMYPVLHLYVADVDDCEEM